MNIDVQADCAGPAILALLPFLVKGALSLSILRAMQQRGLDITVAFYFPETGGYTRDPGDDFAARGRLLDMTAFSGLPGVEQLQHLIDALQVGLLLQIGAPQAYSQLPYLKERRPALRILDTLYNKVGHTVDFFRYESCFDGVIVESADMRDFVRARSRKGVRVSLVESGIDLADFVSTARAPGSPFVLGYVGRMSPEKNPLGFISIAERLHAALPQLQFAIFGEGGMEKQVRARAEASPAATAIRFEGYAPHARDAFAAIDVLVVPSKLDGRPNAIMEANASGVPVIGAPVGGIPELIEDGVNGLVAAPDDHARILLTVAGWVNDSAGFERLRHSCRAKAEQQYDRKRMLDDYEAVFRSALARAGGDG